MRRTATWALGPVLMTACTAGVVSTGLPVAPTPADAAMIERIVDDTSGAQPDLRRLKLYTASDGSRIACGDWTAPDGIGTTDWAPFYIRWRNGAVLRVHLDDATGFGPAILGCNQAEAGAVRVSG